MVNRWWRGSGPLTTTGLLMLPMIVVAGIGLLVDPRVIAGAPAWLKPAKFAVSIAIYTFTLAWIFTLIPDWIRTRRIVGWTTAVTLVLEMVIIAGQALRGTTSHFNVSTPMDAALFTIMGSAIVVQTVSTISVAVALWRTTLPDRALGWALRLGMAMTIVGAFTGGLMTRPTAHQLDAARRGEPMLVAGAHTVGAADGCPGIPGTGWSTTHGDLRVAHFLGLHALQALPLFTLGLGRRRVNEARRVRLTLIAAASYVALFGILLQQALRGYPLLAPDPSTCALLATWGIATAAAGWLGYSKRATRTIESAAGQTTVFLRADDSTGRRAQSLRAGRNPDQNLKTKPADPLVKSRSPG